MDLMLLAPDCSPIGCVANVEGDIEVGGDNDFRLIIARTDYEPLLKLYQTYVPNATAIAGGMKIGARLAVIGTEWGGFVGKDFTDTEDEIYELYGTTFRGYLKQKIIAPKHGQDYYIASGDIRDVVYDLLNGDGATGSSNPSFLDTIGVQDSPAGVTVTNYQFDRYINMNDGIVKMLASVNYKMVIRNEYTTVEGNYGERVVVKPIIYFEPINDYSSQIVLSQNNKFSFQLSRVYDGINHLICLGRGELKNRVVAHLYADRNGTISTTQTLTGEDERVAVYDYPSVETVDELLSKGADQLKKLMGSEQFSMNILSDDMDAKIGDYIGGKDYYTGYFIKQPITKKILTISSDGEWSIEYSIEGVEVEDNEY